MRAQTRGRAPGHAAAGAMFTRTALTFFVATMTAAAPGAAAPPAAAVQGGGDARDEGKPARQPATVTSKDGTTIACARSGKGPVVVLVAGALCDRSMNAGLASLLEQRFTVINFDRRGRGGSTDTPPHAVEREVEDIEALIDAAGGTAFLYGISSGAVLALEAASRLPTKVTRLVLYEPPFIVDDSRPPLPAEFARKLTELLAADRRGDAVAYFMTDAVGVPSEAVAGMRRAPMWAGLEKVAHTLPYDLAVMGDTQAGKPLPRQRWAGSKAATLVVAGEKTDVWLRHAARALAAVLPGATEKVLPGQSHMVAPAALAPVLVEFFAPSADLGEPAGGRNPGPRARAPAALR